MTPPAPPPRSPRPPLLSLLAAAHALGSAGALALLFLVNSVVATETRNPEGVPELLVGMALVLGGAAALGFVAARGFARGYRYAAWCSTALVWGVPCALVATRRTDALLLAPLLAAAVLSQASVAVAWRRGLLGPAPAAEAGVHARRTLGLAVVVSLFGWMAQGMAFAGVGRIEAAVIGDLRTFAAAEAAYSQSNDGLYERRIECLARPQECLPGIGPIPPFLTSSTAQRLTKPHPSFWEFRLHTVDGPPPAPAGALRSRTSVVRFALQARPLRPDHAGVRTFCVDSTGRLCANREGGALAIVDGACPAPPECPDL
jgi:hypothetical protein